ncbi:MAG: exo-beta-N-acetylmuramidase NamZ domain-containing protein [Bdellovibrionales bacterium]
MKIQLGLDRLLREREWKERLKGKRVALLAHPASVTESLEHSLDALMGVGVKIACAFGPQHGMRGEKQDNMIESADYHDPVHKIPVYSLYGEVRRPTAKMLDCFDVLLIDLQDVGCRIYTFLTTLFYVLQDCAKAGGKEVWVLERPNPAGRPIEGNKLDMKFASFVGAAPVPMRHGLTLGEAALWFRDHAKLNVELQVVEMRNYSPELEPGYGWPGSELAWVNPSPNMPRLSTARQYAGTVLIEGTRLSEARGTTRPLEMFGAPGLDMIAILKTMHEQYEPWLRGCKLRPAFYEPTFHKFKGQLVNALQIHVDGTFYDHERFTPYRLVCAFLKSVHQHAPDFDLWLPPPYEYEREKMPIDILSGNSRLREWVAEDDATAADFDKFLSPDESAWAQERHKYLLY